MFHHWAVHVRGLRVRPNPQTNPWNIMNTTNAYRLVSLICGAMCLILAIGGQAIAAGTFGMAAGVFGYLSGGRK